MDQNSPVSIIQLCVCVISGLFIDALCLIYMRRALLGPSGSIFSTGMLCIKLIKLVLSEVRHFSICQTTGCNKRCPLDNTVHIVPLLKLYYSNAHKLLFVRKRHTSTPDSEETFATGPVLKVEAYEINLSFITCIKLDCITLLKSESLQPCCNHANSC